MNQSIDNFLSIIEGFHTDNRKLEHFARFPQNRVISTMPLTAFVYQFFLYNSLYQIDWDSSFRNNELIYHKNYTNQTSDGLKEWQQQSEFEKFMQKRDMTCTHLLTAFQPLSKIQLNGNWTSVIPDERVRSNDGHHFFRRMRELKMMASSNEASKTVDSLYDDVGKCRSFVYTIRCNIFHGSKTLGQIHDPNQKQRINVYFEFLHGLMSAFFNIVKVENKRY